MAGLPYQSQKRHSFCIGAASFAAAARLLDWLIKVSQSLVLGLLPAVYQNSSIFVKVWLPGCLLFLDASSQSSFRIFHLFIRSLVGAWGDTLPRMHCMHAVKSAQRLPPSFLAALSFNIACKPILLSDPARAVLHSARSAGEISEVLWSRHRRKSRRLT